MCHSEQLQGINLLLVHGEDDPRVPQEHGDRVASAAKSLNVPGAYVTYSQEGHSIRREANVLHLWHMVERFLCASLELPAAPSVLGDSELMAKNTATIQHWRSHAGLSPLK